MTTFIYLSARQQAAMLGEVADGGVRRALARRGLVEHDNLTGFQPVTLTNLGRLLMLHHAQENNQSSQFIVGQTAIYLTFAVRPFPWVFTGGVVRIVARGIYDSALTIEDDAGQRRLVSARQLASFSAANAAGLLDQFLTVRS